MEADEFERGVMVAMMPTLARTQEELLRANEFVNQLRTTTEGWRYCLARTFQASTPATVAHATHVRFFCFQTLHDTILTREESLTEEDRQLLRTGLVRWLKEYMPAHPEEDPSVKNKYAQTLIQLFKSEYPERWPTFFSELFACLPLGAVVVEVFLRVLEAFDKLVVVPESARGPGDIAHSTIIKDYMRTDCVPMLAELLYNVTVAYRSGNMPQLAVMCLLVIKCFIGWIDIQLIVNEKYMTLFYELLAVEQFRDAACECLFEIANKGMEPLSKMELLNRMKLQQILTNYSSIEHAKFQRSQAKILNVMGVELLAGWNRLEKMLAEGAITAEMAANGRALVEETIPLLCKYLNSKSDKTSAAVQVYLTSYLNKLKKFPQLDERQMEHLKNFLTIIANKIRYPPEYNFEKEDDFECNFLEFRNDTGLLFTKILKISPQLVAAWVHSAFTTTIANLRSLPLPDVEISLHLLTLLGNAISSLEDNVKAVMTAFMTQILPLAINSDLTAYPHRAVVLSTFNLVVDHGKCLPADPVITQALINIFLSERGLRHADRTIRSRSCYQLNRILKMRKQLLPPFAEQILTALKGVVAIGTEKQQYIPHECKMFLYEAIGTVVSSITDSQIRAALLQMSVAPILEGVNNVITQQLYTKDTLENPIWETYISECIAALVALNKGLGVVPEAESEIWQKGLELVLKVGVAMANSSAVRQNVTSYIHRMVDSTGRAVIPFIPFAINLFLSSNKASSTELTDFLRLVNQLVNKFKTDMLSVLNEILEPILHRLRAILSIPVKALSEEARELDTMLKMYYTFVKSIVQNPSLSTVFLSPKNTPLFDIVLASLLGGLTANEMGTVKACLESLNKMIETWGKGEVALHVPPAFKAFTVQQVVPACFKQCLDPCFNVADAASYGALMEMALTQQLLVRLYNAELLQYLSGTILPTIFPGNNEAAAAYLAALQNPDLRIFKAFLKDVVVALRSQAPRLSGT